MKKLMGLLLMTSLLSSCAFLSPHKKDIEQGNLYTDNQVRTLRTGMTQKEVANVMGTEPVMKNIFTPSLMVYVYTLQPGGKTMTEKSVICTFQNGRLIAISTK